MRSLAQHILAISQGATGLLITAYIAVGIGAYNLAALIFDRLERLASGEWEGI